MGLDNMPNEYPCKTRGTAVLEPRLDGDGKPMTNEDGTPFLSINCEKTQELGGCPYKASLDASDADQSQAVYGMFGTDCWYRGKYGNHLLMSVGIYDEPHLSFYGDTEEAAIKTPESCFILADEISEVLAEMTDIGGHLIVDDEDIAPRLRYAEWYLRWAAENANGLNCWY